MAALVGRPFGETFSFARSATAACRDETGELVTMAIDVPAFDHREDGAPAGLIVGAGPRWGEGDRLRVIAGDWELRGPATVLHALIDETGAPVRRATYTLAVRATVNAALAIVGRHGSIGAVPGFLRNMGGFVRYREMEWLLSNALAADETAILADGSDLARLILDR